MTIKQISVFLENKSGRLNEVARVLAANQINMLAFCIAETTDFGLMRLIVKEGVARCRFRCDIDGCDCHSLS